jgi:nucleoside-diphosphate-sugar epimerase
MSASLFCLGFGYSAATLARQLRDQGWQVAGTARRPERLAELAVAGLTGLLIDSAQPLPANALEGVTHLLVSIPPGPQGDPAASGLQAALRAASAAGTLGWIGYLSTTGVYGDHGGAWVDESTPTAPTGERGQRRVAAECAWQAFGAAHGIKTQIFRLAGIYGPGRSVLDDIRHGIAQRLVRPGQLFSRIHVADIAGTLRAAMTGDSGARIFNVCDDEPAASADVVAYGCALLGVAPPPEIPFTEARLSPMAQSFWADNKRVSNRLLKTALGVRLIYPTYREGLGALAAQLQAPPG